jgi:hypothetical protein
MGDNCCKHDNRPKHRLLYPKCKAAEAYEKFDMRGVGEGAAYTKVLLKPEMDKK